MRIQEHGHVILEDMYGSDLDIVNAARQSFNKRSRSMGKSEVGLINFLMKNRHGTPFEMVDFRFNIKLPIFVAREWFRHRIASYNEMSGRYTEMEKEFFVPKELRSQVGKPGSYTFEVIKDQSKSDFYRAEISRHNEESWSLYQAMLREGVAKEQARIVLPLSIYTQMTFKINLRSLLNFINLRSSDDAMSEIGEYSKVIESILQEKLPVTYAAFQENGRVAP